jgi:hypothetical protein
MVKRIGNEVSLTLPNIESNQEWQGWEKLMLEYFQIR